MKLNSEEEIMIAGSIVRIKPTASQTALAAAVAATAARGHQTPSTYFAAAAGTQGNRSHLEFFKILAIVLVILPVPFPSAFSPRLAVPSIVLPIEVCT